MSDYGGRLATFLVMGLFLTIGEMSMTLGVIVGVGMVVVLCALGIGLGPPSYFERGR